MKPKSIIPGVLRATAINAVAAARGGVYSKILSNEDLESINEKLNRIKGCIDNFESDVNSSLNTFNNNPVVQSLYDSGQFGREMENEIQKIKDGVSKYFNTISGTGGLIERTKSIIESQKELLNTSYRKGNGE